MHFIFLLRFEQCSTVPHCMYAHVRIFSMHTILNRKLLLAFGWINLTIQTMHIKCSPNIQCCLIGVHWMNKKKVKQHTKENCSYIMQWIHCCNRLLLIERNTSISVWVMRCRFDLKYSFEILNLKLNMLTGTAVLRPTIILSIKNCIFIGKVWDVNSSQIKMNQLKNVEKHQS